MASAYHVNYGILVCFPYLCQNSHFVLIMYIWFVWLLELDVCFLVQICYDSSRRWIISPWIEISWYLVFFCLNWSFTWQMWIMEYLYVFHIFIRNSDFVLVVYIWFVWLIELDVYFLVQICCDSSRRWIFNSWSTINH
jgi:hypothetical protein